MSENSMMTMNRAVNEIKRSRNKVAINKLKNVYTTGYKEGYAAAMEKFKQAIRSTPQVGPKSIARIEENIITNYNTDPLVKIIGEEE